MGCTEQLIVVVIQIGGVVKEGIRKITQIVVQVRLYLF